MEVASAPASPADTPHRVNVPTKLTYGVGQLVDAIAATLLPAFLFFYLTAVCGLSGFLAGLSMLITLIIDAIADPFIGALSDNTRSRWGRRHIFMFAALVPLAISIGLLFSIPEVLSEFHIFLYVTGVSIVLRLSYSAYTLPHAALGAELSQDYLERSSIAAYRLTFNSVGSFIPIVLGYSVFLTGSEGVLDRGAYSPFAWTCAALLLGAGLFCSIATLRLRHGLYVAPSHEGNLGRALLHDVLNLARHRSARILVGVVLMFNIAQGVVINLNLHANKYFWNLSEEGMRVVGLSQPIGILLGALIGAWCARHFEKKPVVAYGLVAMCFVEAAIPLLRITGVVPDNEQVILALVIPGRMIMYIAYMALLISFTSMVADAADEHEQIYGVRREGLFFAGVAFATKAAAGFGGLWAGMVLDMIGFPKAPNEAPIDPEVVTRLGYAAGPVAAALTMICVVILMGYRLDKKRHTAILEELNRRRV
ncbi:MAG: MFS transporter [Hyphomonadaceae bacterium]|nr:MFS transporter [Hyphomonadaceae bacterium]